jgi:hypothetical protein
MQPIDRAATFQSLCPVLAELGGKTLVETLANYDTLLSRARPQSELPQVSPFPFVSLTCA